MVMVVPKSDDPLANGYRSGPTLPVLLGAHPLGAEPSAVTPLVETVLVDDHRRVTKPGRCKHRDRKL